MEAANPEAQAGITGRSEMASRDFCCELDAIAPDRLRRLVEKGRSIAIWTKTNSAFSRLRRRQSVICSKDWLE